MRTFPPFASDVYFCNHRSFNRVFPLAGILPFIFVRHTF